MKDFAYVASHDLQEPLWKIQAFSDRLRYHETLGPEGQDYLDRLHAAAQRMQVLIQDLLSLSRIATAGQPFVEVDLEAEVRQVWSDLMMAVEEAEAELEIEALPTIEADPSQMRQLFQNLFSNAIKFRRTDRPLRIQVGATRLPAASVIQLQVRDNGIGFESRFAERVFGPFERLHGRSEYPGTGIGLTICQRIAERHGGTISASSELGQGATFTITLPVRQS